MAQHIDAPLREDVRLLGNLLGETLKAHAGDALFNRVEQIRTLAKVHVMDKSRQKSNLNNSS